MNSLGICSYCGRQIKWIKTVHSKSMPCDPTPCCYVEEHGGPDRIVTAEGEVLAGRFVGVDKDLPVGWKSHFGSCPNKELAQAARARRRKHV